ncbi:alpha/beta hydrolase fold domain-containing protein [Oryzifoliimicrobium ureilyticus]|uniref:alpha/beta hydrolase fold domain-containing protein n=1 Tax=Oryzifoliimicrobium ureilyticus TaxID=3113724 RepID=UPI003075FDFA
MAVEIKDMMLDKVAAGPVAARAYLGADYVKGPPVVLYFRSGAFVDYRVDIECRAAETMASTGAIVVMADYGTLSGGVFPKALEVSFSVLSYFVNKRANKPVGLGDKKSPLFLAGTEAGGNIAAGVALKARDAFPGVVGGQILMSPMVDPFMGTASVRHADEIGMRARWSEGWSHYLGAAGCHPYAAPCMCSRISGVAPALVMTSADDPLKDETISYADKLRAAGVEVFQQILPVGTGWPSIYGGAVQGSTGEWPGLLGQHFEGFVKHIGDRPSTG